jgi:hypothetical protein
MNDIFSLTSQVVFEPFDDGALLLRLRDRHLFELNQTSREILVRTNGQQSVAQIAVDLAELYQLQESEASQDVLALYEQLSDQGIVERVNFMQE